MRRVTDFHGGSRSRSFDHGTSRIGGRSLDRGNGVARPRSTSRDGKPSSRNTKSKNTSVIGWLPTSFFSAIIYPWLDIGLPPRCPQVVLCY